MASTPDTEKFDDELFKRMFETLGIESPLRSNIDALLVLQKKIDDHVLFNVRSEADIKMIRTQIKTRKQEIKRMKDEMKKLACPVENEKTK